MGHPSQIRGIADTVAKTVNDKAVGPEVVVSEVDWVTDEAVHRRKRGAVERSNEWHEFRATHRETSNLVSVTMDSNVPFQEGRRPSGREVVPIEMGQTKGRYVGYSDAGSIKAHRERAWTDAGVNKQDTARRTDERRITSGAAGKDAEFERHRSPWLPNATASRWRP